MTVQQIKQSVNLQNLDDWGTAGLPGTTPIQVSGVQRMIKGNESIDAGIFECAAGTYRCSVKQGEAMHFLSGRRRFTPGNEQTIHFASGDTLFFKANTEEL